ncbi:DUF4870 domain-containing protein [Ornithinimicrobium cerasi]|uniref:DUF4870 domain-containing protein n=1 Tax=Ornithinimicrobium cerasi TaxID=2248773 RepID=UPI001F2DD3B3|nr:DUF4870 domain-containing protein [Ornithinimicrobium cerasi]
MTQPGHDDRPYDSTDPQRPGAVPPPPGPLQGGYQGASPQGAPGQGWPAGGYQPGGPQGSGAGGAGGEERTMMLIAHLSAPVSFLVSGAWLPFLGPLLVWLFYKDRSPAVRTAAAGAFNFNIMMTIASVVTWISVIITLGIGLIWAIPIWIVLFVVQLWMHIKGAMKASNGEVYTYPWQIRILS